MIDHILRNGGFRARNRNYKSNEYIYYVFDEDGCFELFQREELPEEAKQFLWENAHNRHWMDYPHCNNLRIDRVPL